MRETTRILGIDPGSRATGYGIIDARRRGSECALVHWGTIQTQGEHSERLKQIFAEMGDLVREFMPGEVAIERVFVHRNPRQCLEVGPSAGGRSVRYV